MTSRTELGSTVDVEQLGRVRRLTLNRPDVLNALSLRCQEELVAAVLDAEQDPGTHVVIVRGAGRAFSAGYDLSSPKREVTTGPAEYERATAEEDFRAVIDMGRRWNTIFHARIPIIAQVHGYCLAGATDLVLHCDLVVVADDAIIGCPEVRSMGVPLAHMWIYHVGPQWAKRLLLTGDTMTGASAAAIGMALESVPVAELESRVLALAERIALIGRPLLRANKDVVNQGLELMGRGILQHISAAQDTIAHLSPDYAAFKRTAREQGLARAFQQRDAPFREGEPV